MARRNNSKALKKKTTAARGHACEVCGWTGPEPYWRRRPLVHVHHVIPVSCGGTDTADNLILLCPNHHAIAHRTMTVVHGRPIGPATRDDLIAALRRDDIVPWHAGVDVSKLPW